MSQEVRCHADNVSFILLGRFVQSSKGKDALLFAVFLCKNNDNYRDSQIKKKKLIRYKVQRTKNNGVMGIVCNACEDLLRLIWGFSEPHVKTD